GEPEGEGEEPPQSPEQHAGERREGSVGVARRGRNVAERLASRALGCRAGVVVRGATHEVHLGARACRGGVVVRGRAPSLQSWHALTVGGRGKSAGTLDLPSPGARDSVRARVSMRT